jgi:hypothetical protein
MTKTNMTNWIPVTRSAISRRKNLLNALNKAFYELDNFTQWTTGTPENLEYNCCTNCMTGSPRIENAKNYVAYNIQDKQGYNEAYKENRESFKWSSLPESHKGEYIYLLHNGESHASYKLLIGILKQHGITTDWDWDSNQKLRVYLTKYTHFNSGV